MFVENGESFDLSETIFMANFHCRLYLGREIAWKFEALGIPLHEILLCLSLYLDYHDISQRGSVCVEEAAKVLRKEAEQRRANSSQQENS